MCVAPGPYRATQGRGWGQFGDAGSMSGPVAGSFRLPGGQRARGGATACLTRAVNALTEWHWAFQLTELARSEAVYGSGVVKSPLNRH